MHTINIKYTHTHIIQRIMLKIQTILQNILQTADMVKDYW